MRVLIAEDDAVARLLLAGTLERAGATVVATPDGTTAWAAYQAEPFPLVISDWIMPGLDGLELSRRIRADRRLAYTYLMLLTVREGRGHLLEAVRAGIDDFLTKPLDPEVLQARLVVAERILDLKRHCLRLEGLLPICSYCKRIRESDQAWTTVEAYVSRRSEAQFSHSICPHCYETVVKPEFDQFKESR